MLRLEIRRLQQATRLTTLLVTHDQEEAMTMADRVAVMNDGRLVQVDEPRNVYQRPADAFTAAFVGMMNLLEGWTVGPGQTLRRGEAVLRTAEALAAPVGSRVTIGFRPEEAALERAEASPRRDNVLECLVRRVEFRGPFVRLYLALCGDEDQVVRADVPAGGEPGIEQASNGSAHLHVWPESVRVFRDPGRPS
jgi:ABC-type Fe3+/spermidine/putrescine transport system ATPase subunit